MTYADNEKTAKKESIKKRQCLKFYWGIASSFLACPSSIRMINWVIYFQLATEVNQVTGSNESKMSEFTYLIWCIIALSMMKPFLNLHFYVWLQCHLKSRVFLSLKKRKSNLYFIYFHICSAIKIIYFRADLHSMFKMTIVP